METQHAPTPTEIVANRLVELCSQGKNHEAMIELYADDARHIEAMEMPGSPRITEGKENLLKAAEEFWQTTEVHSAGIGKPNPNGDQFIVEAWMDATMKAGPMTGQRFEMREHCLYTVKDGKITEAKFFYGA